MVLLQFLNGCSANQGLTKTGDDYAVKAAHVELAERMRKVGFGHFYLVYLTRSLTEGLLRIAIVTP